MDKKTERIINISQRLAAGEAIIKSAEAERFGVNERTIQRDLDDVKTYYANDPTLNRELKYDRARKAYLLVQDSRQSLTNSEILTVCKILLESRSMVKEEMYPIIDKLVENCVPTQNKELVSSLIANEKYHYIEPHHGKKFVEKIWNIGSAVNEQRLIRIKYRKLKESEPVTRLVQPVGIMFSEYYFYLNAFICADENYPDAVRYQFPTSYRIDRIESYELLDEHFHLPYADRFEEGEFRKRVQFMFGGELKTVKFRYKGLSIEAVLDRLPTAKVISHSEKDGYIIRAEVYGDGVDMWLRSQGDSIELL